ncbi:Hypothetical predicted protein, partial [Pelobates cultripes]
EEEGAVCPALYKEDLIDRTEAPIQDELVFRNKEHHQLSHKEADLQVATGIREAPSGR